ncbi:polyamine aminopropyltransferase [bacterium endosymbiont of Pedicinus badii]|uniref:polyamine aminopropyltransferase n=1 Tax=bacterium endosymbiont of Pedicinus badii TaxID=1719126 RepID=UPI0009BA5E2A|nr:polyamine aminopropyltransferase [bacterium endosymbiont of Pedicinus badii]OQM34233.1 spermidine synthase [bacterium endosymbiont of Pedicinus badii]
MKKKIFFEKLHNKLGQYFIIDKIIYNGYSSYQKVLIFKNSILGKVLSLDGVVQTTEKDEFIYHESMTHIPIFSHPDAKKILIIGGGDGGILREICLHESIKKIVMVEVDELVIEVCKKYLSNHSKNAFSDARLDLIIQNGMDFIKKNKEKFDIIISDCTDPIGPGKILFTKKFYKECLRCLKKNGIFVAQNGVFFFQKLSSIQSYKILKKQFLETKFYQSSIPTYYGGIMLFLWGSKNKIEFYLDKKRIEKRIQNSNINFRYYNSDIHFGSFCLPQYLLKDLL